MARGDGNATIIIPGRGALVSFDANESTFLRPSRETIEACDASEGWL